MRAPDTWDRNDNTARLIRAALAPAAWAYGTSVRWNAAHATSFRAGVPVICIGNISAGGTGKTPIAITVAKALIAKGKRPVFLSRGYGGQRKGPVVVNDHDAAEIGDEPLLLARTATTIVARNRRLGAMEAIKQGADVIVMDDGHQNFTLHKDLSLVVVDAETGFGNGHVLPAGPLREPIAQGLSRADAVILSGEGSPTLPAFERPVLRAKIAPFPTEEYRGRRVVAFAGIGRPKKLFATLTSLGAELTATVAFADHHRYTQAEIAMLKAQTKGAPLVTTEKDYIRIPPTLRSDITALPVAAVITPADGLDRLLDSLWHKR